MIALKQLNKIYHVNNQDFQALKNINLSVGQGEIFGLLGKSGAGKSTLLRCVNLLEKPTSGHVYINGIDLTTLSTAALREQRHKIGLIFQHFNLLESRTAFENIALPMEIINCPQEKINEKVSSLLALIGLAHRKNYYPSQLSGGQKQRVAIARALATDPYVLLCDEATSALDPESTKSILDLLKRINRELGLTILLITHELEVIKQICDRVGVISDGELIEQDLAINILLHPKTALTRQLVQKRLDFDITKHHASNSVVLQLTFVGDVSDEPLISSLVKKFAITVNIRQALIEKIQDTTVGFTICELTGLQAELERALQYINSTSVKVEVLNNA